MLISLKCAKMVRVNNGYLPTYQRGDRKKELTKQNDKNFDNDSFRNVAIAVVMMMMTMSK